MHKATYRGTVKNTSVDEVIDTRVRGVSRQPTWIGPGL